MKGRINPYLSIDIIATFSFGFRKILPVSNIFPFPVQYDIDKLMSREGFSPSYQRGTDGGAIVSLSGRISIDNIGKILHEFTPFLNEKLPSRLAIDLANVDYLDSSGALMLIEMEEKAKAKSIPFEFINVSDKTKEMVALINRDALRVTPLIAEKRTTGIIEKIGEESIDFYNDIIQVIAFGGELVLEILYSILHPRSVRLGDVILYMKKVGVDGLPIIGLISFLLGLILAFMSALQLKQFGANIYVPALLSIAMVRELGPIMTAILVAGRSGSAFAAEIGTMKVNEEVDALITMGFNPIRFLAIPKIFAAIVVVPFLTLFADIFAIAGGLLIGIVVLDLTVYTYIQQTIKAIDMFNIVMSIIKSMVLATLIAGIGCQRGFTVRGGAQDVGNATTSAVVAGLFLIIVVDSIFAILLNYI
ncbi:MAG: MlaE family lipid ABC transporter permease subunit [Proteobacteria bacterium]|nr:MlaE family lipid ABC transporter permease subunit [Pseudomonadota bacterium]